jgi:hypothetical protein
VVERLFQLNKKKLLSIPLFAWGYGYWRRMMDYLETTAASRTSRRPSSTFRNCGMALTPPELVAAHLNIDRAVIETQGLPAAV